MAWFVTLSMTPPQYTLRAQRRNSHIRSALDCRDVTHSFPDDEYLLAGDSGKVALRLREIGGVSRRRVSMLTQEAMSYRTTVVGSLRNIADRNRRIIYEAFLKGVGGIERGTVKRALC